MNKHYIKAMPTALMLWAVASLILTACGPVPSPAAPTPTLAPAVQPPDTPTPAAEPTVAVELTAVKWVLTSLDDTPVSAEITAQFADGQISGSAGCNQYFAEYRLEGDKLAVGPVASTKMMCEEGVMKQEKAFLAALQTAYAYRIVGDRLQIEHEGGVLTFAAQ